MHYKPDFDEIVPRMEAWWNLEVLDRACIRVTAPSGARQRDVPTPNSVLERRTNKDYLLDRAEAEMEATFYGGEAIPVFRPNLGPDAFAACLGAKLEFTDGRTVSWAKPCIENWLTPPSFELDTASFVWQWYLDMYPLSAERGAGRFFVAAPDCHSGGDCLLAMRGGAPLAMDLYDHPDAVHCAMARLEKAVVGWHETFWPLIESAGQRGHTTGFREVWSRARSQALQLDLLAIISPDHFRTFFRHELSVQEQCVELAAFHLDGPDALVHLPVLYPLFEDGVETGSGRQRPSLRAIQWEPGAGNYPMIRWIPVLKEIQAYGINVEISCAPSEVETLITELSSRGLLLSTQVDAREEAEDIIRLVAARSHD